MNHTDPQSAQLVVDRFLDRHPLPVSDPHPCPYRSDQIMVNEGFASTDMPAWLYRQLLDRNFRRSGRSFYRPNCPTCDACRQIRVPARTFRMSSSQRRVWRRNADVTVCVRRHPTVTDEKWSLFRRYVRDRHDDTMSTEHEDMVDFLYDSPTRTIEFEYRHNERLLAVSIVDRCPDALSSVYVYFDPDLPARSLGHFTALWEIAYCQRMNYDHYYLGYHIEDAPKMAYKSRYRPCELLTNRATWLNADGVSSA